MNEQSDFLKRLTAKLSVAGIPFMVVGSVAASYHGHPRSTLDIDLVGDADEERLCHLARSLGEDYYVSEESVRGAARSRTVFNIIDEASGTKQISSFAENGLQPYRIRSPHARRRDGNHPGNRCP